MSRSNLAFRCLLVCGEDFINAYYFNPCSTDTLPGSANQSLNITNQYHYWVHVIGTSISTASVALYSESYVLILYHWLYTLTNPLLSVHTTTITIAVFISNLKTIDFNHAFYLTTLSLNICSSIVLNWFDQWFKINAILIH